MSKETKEPEKKLGDGGADWSCPKCGKSGVVGVAKAFLVPRPDGAAGPFNVAAQIEEAHKKVSPNCDEKIGLVIKTDGDNEPDELLTALMQLPLGPWNSKQNSATT